MNIDQGPQSAIWAHYVGQAGIMSPVKHSDLVTGWVSSQIKNFMFFFVVVKQPEHELSVQTKKQDNKTTINQLSGIWLVSDEHPEDVGNGWTTWGIIGGIIK